MVNVHDNLFDVQSTQCGFSQEGRSVAHCPRSCRGCQQSKHFSGDPYTIRFKMPRNEDVRFEDEIRGWVVVNTNNLDDKILFKSDGMPTYHLANIVDDHTMAISHVIRGEEWLPSAPLHVLLYRAFEWDCPKFAHLPLILKPNGNRSSMSLLSRSCRFFSNSSTMILICSKCFNSDLPSSDGMLVFISMGRRTWEKDPLHMCRASASRKPDLLTKSEPPAATCDSKTTCAAHRSL